MRAPAVSFAKRFVAAALAALLTFTLVPASAFAEGEGDTVSTSAEGTQEADPGQAEEAAGASPEADDSASFASSAQAGTLAASLMGRPASFVNADVALDGEPVVGSFTVDGLTFAVTEGSSVQLVGVSEAAGASPRRVVAESQGLSAPLALPDLGSTPTASEPEAETSVLVLPESTTYDDAEYSVTSIGAYAFYLSGTTSVELPASVTDVDDRAFRSSDVASVEVAEGNPHYSSFDGVLYDADYSSLLLIPEGKQGTVLLPSTAESAAPSVFSHCPLVTQISVEEGSAAFASENGLLYTSDLTTLLRVPAGATEITIHDGCTTIAAGAMEACASLATINAPASVTSISPDVLTSVPTVSLPAATVADDGVEKAEGAFGSEVPTSPQPPSASSTEASGSAGTQLTALVALASVDDSLPEVNASDIKVALASGAESSVWVRSELSNLSPDSEPASAQAGSTYDSTYSTVLTNLANVSAYPKWRSSSTSWNLGNPMPSWAAASWSIGPGQSMTLNGIGTNAIASSGITGNKGDHLAMPLSVANGAWISWFTSNTLTTGSMSTIFLIYYEKDARTLVSSSISPLPSKTYLYCSDSPTANRTITWDAQGGTCDEASTTVSAMTAIQHSPVPVRPGYRCTGWYVADGFPFEGQKVCDPGGATGPIVEDRTFVARWESLTVGFDTSSEPEDENYPGAEKPSVSAPEVVDNEGKIEVSDPKRPGYVFQGWTIPNDEGTEAIDQELVYRDETDGKWYVDASKLPDYADGSGRVELTARWTSVISVDVPSAVTFYADVVTQGNESREGAASSAFGQNKVASQSQVDLRIVGLESAQVQGNGSTAFGASDILSKKDGGAVSGTADKLFSLYPTSKALTPDDLQDPDAVSAAKPADAVDFALDDILLEKSFAADKFTIPAGDTLNLGYRLNLSETGTELDYDKLSTLDEGQSASIANISYCFAANYDSPADWGEPLWIENPDTSEGAPRFLVLDDIKAAAEDLSAHASNPAQSSYYPLYRSLLDQGASFHLNVGGTYHDVQVLGICQDTKTSGGKAGLTFGFKEVYGFRPMNAEADNTGGWASSAMRSYLNGEFFGALGAPLRDPATGIVPVDKAQQGGSEATTQVQVTRGDKVFIPSSYELYGLDWDTESSANSFQYQWFAKTETYMTGVGTICANDGTIKYKNGATQFWWGRTGAIYDTTRFFHVGRDGTRCFNKGSMALGVVPCFAL